MISIVLNKLKMKYMNVVRTVHASCTIGALLTEVISIVLNNLKIKYINVVRSVDASCTIGALLVKYLGFSIIDRILM